MTAITGLLHVRQGCVKMDKMSGFVQTGMAARGGFTIGWDIDKNQEGKWTLYGCLVEVSPQDNYCRSVGKQLVEQQLEDIKITGAHNPITQMSRVLPQWLAEAVETNTSQIHYIDTRTFGVRQMVSERLLSQWVVTNIDTYGDLVSWKLFRLGKKHTVFLLTVKERFLNDRPLVEDLTTLLAQSWNHKRK